MSNSGLADTFIRMFPNNNAPYFEAAFTTALQSSAHHKHGAVVVSDGHILRTGYNRPHDINDTNEDPDEKWDLIHAETDAIEGLSEEILSNCIVFVCKIGESGMPAYSRPCNYCRMVLPVMGVHCIIYTIPTAPYFAEENF